MQTILQFAVEHRIQLLQYWLSFFIVGTVVLYIGFGFVMSAIRAKEEGKTQTVVWVADVALALIFLVLDVLLNIFVYTFICFDWKPKNIFTTISHRMSRYNTDETEWRYRKVIASLFGAALDGKDPKGDHITGPNIYFKWLGVL